MYRTTNNQKISDNRSRMSRHVIKESQDQMVKNIDGRTVRYIGIILESQAAEQNQFHADAPKLERERVSEAESITVNDPIALERPRGGRSIPKHSYQVLLRIPYGRSGVSAN